MYKLLGQITAEEAKDWTLDDWKDFHTWMANVKGRVSGNINEINNILIPEYEEIRQAEKSKEATFNDWYQSVQSSLDNSNMPNEVKGWSKDEWKNFYNYLLNNGGIYYPTVGEMFYKQLRSYINLTKGDDEGDNNIIVEEPINVEEQEFKSWYNSITAHLNKINPAEARDWDEDKWRGFYKYMRDILHLQGLDIPSPGSDFNRYLSDYIKTLR